MYWAEEEDQPQQVRQIIALVREVYPDLRWTRLWVRNPKVDDDFLWMFWLPDKTGDVQIEAGQGVCPFLVGTDKHEELFDGETVEKTAEKVIEWLALPGGATDYFWHPR